MEKLKVATMPFRFMEEGKRNNKTQAEQSSQTWLN